MGLLNKAAIYPGGYIFVVESNNQTAIPIMDLPPGTLVTRVLVEVIKPAVRSAGNVFLMVGDNVIADGYIAPCDAKASAGTLYGSDTAQPGGYLKATETHILQLKLDTTVDTQGIYRIIVEFLGFHLIK